MGEKQGITDSLIFMFIRAHRERKFEFMVITLQKLVPLFFALDPQNDARLIPVFIRDLDGLPDTIQAQFKEGHWTITGSNHCFSSILIDQTNKNVKGDCGIIGLTEKPEMYVRCDWPRNQPRYRAVYH